MYTAIPPTTETVSGEEVVMMYTPVQLANAQQTDYHIPTKRLASSDKEGTPRKRRIDVCAM